MITCSGTTDEFPARCRVRTSDSIGHAMILHHRIDPVIDVLRLAPDVMAVHLHGRPATSLGCAPSRSRHPRPAELALRAHRMPVQRSIQSSLQARASAQRIERPSGFQASAASARLQVKSGHLHVQGDERSRLPSSLHYRRVNNHEVWLVLDPQFKLSRHPSSAA